MSFIGDTDFSRGQWRCPSERINPMKMSSEDKGTLLPRCLYELLFLRMLSKSIPAKDWRGWVIILIEVSVPSNRLKGFTNPLYRPY